jgi:hypothetical protein
MVQKIHKYSMKWYTQKQKEDDMLRSRILARTVRLEGETPRQHLKRMYGMYLKQKDELYR